MLALLLFIHVYFFRTFAFSLRRRLRRFWFSGEPSIPYYSIFLSFLYRTYLSLDTTLPLFLTL